MNMTEPECTAFEIIERYLKQLVRADDLDKLPISRDELQYLLTVQHWNELNTALVDKYWAALDVTPPYVIRRLDDGSIAIVHRGHHIKTWSPEWIEKIRSARCECL